MGRHHSRSRSPRRERHRDEDRRDLKENDSRRRDGSPRRDSHRHGGRHRSPDVRRGDSPRSRHHSSERRHGDEKTDGRRAGGRSLEQREPPPPADTRRGRDAHREALPPPPEGGKPGKRRSRFNQSPDETQLAAAALPPPPRQPEPEPLQEAPAAEEATEPEPDFGLSGALAAESNKVNGVVLLHSEPAEAATPQQRWRLYQFKSGKPFQEPLPIHRQSCYLFGRERRVADVPTDHPSCSKQHAVLQFRRTEKEGADGMLHAAVRPYLLDLGSVNGTFVNNERIEGERYYELLEQDMIRFGNSTREYVLLHEGSSVQ